jgi:hypothetical protein
MTVGAKPEHFVLVPLILELVLFFYAARIGTRAVTYLSFARQKART